MKKKIFSFSVLSEKKSNFFTKESINSSISDFPDIAYKNGKWKRKTLLLKLNS